MLYDICYMIVLSFQFLSAFPDTSCLPAPSPRTGLLLFDMVIVVNITYK